MNHLFRNMSIRKIITKQYHCIGSISEGYIICPTCNIQTPTNVEIKEVDIQPLPEPNKIERPDQYPDMRGHVDRY